MTDAMGASRPGGVSGIARLADADQSAVGHANGRTARMPQAPRLILSAPDAAAGDAAAMAVRTTAAESRRRGDGRRHINRDESESDEGSEKFVHVEISLSTPGYWRPVLESPQISSGILNPELMPPGCF